MALEIIAWRPNSSFKQTVLLDGVSYVLWAKWNASYEYWTLDFLTPDLVPIASGIKLALGSELIRRRRDPALPPGNLVVFDISETAERVGRDQMGVDMLLVYENTDPDE